MSERELASELTVALLRAGSDVDLPFAPIVSSGPNTANPQASPSDRKLQAGDLLLFDWGAAYQGYLSDLTRTFSCEPACAEYPHPLPANEQPDSLCNFYTGAATANHYQM